MRRCPAVQLCLALFLCLALLPAGRAFAADAGEAGRELPRPTKLSWIEASIRAVQDNGVAERVSRDHGVQRSDGTRALPLKHVVACETESACSEVARWARRAGLAPSETVTEYGHGGVPHYEIHLRQHVPLVSRQIQAGAVFIHEALQRMPGTRYATWMLDVDPEGRHSAR